MSTLIVGLLNGCAVGLRESVRSIAKTSPAERRQSALDRLREAQLLFELENVTPEGVNIAMHRAGAGRAAVLVGAHYDSALLLDGNGGPGAIDNATGAAIVVRLASEVKDGAIDFVLFDQEETGFKGSRAYVVSHPAPRVYVNVDVFGVGDIILIGNYGVSLDSLAVQSLCRRESLKCVIVPEVPSSDHVSFVEAGVRSLAVSLVTQEDLCAVVAAQYRPSDIVCDGRYKSRGALGVIHTRQDLPSRVDYDAMERGCRVVKALLSIITKGEWPLH